MFQYDGSPCRPFGANAVPRRYRVFAWIAPLLLLNWLLLAVVPIIPAGGPVESFAIQLVGGTIFAQSAVAAAWTAFGPIQFGWRLPLSLTWLAMLSFIHAVNGWLNGGLPSGSISVGVLLLCHWLLLQFPLWGIAIGYGVQLRHADDTEIGNSIHRQFGIRQLMIVTAVVGMLFGVGRIAVPYFLKEIEAFPIIASVIAFLVTVEVVMTLPLAVAALLRRHVVIGVLSALTLIGAVTACELPLLKMVIPMAGGSSVLGIIAANVGTAITLLALLTIVRLNGYSLGRSTKSVSKALPA